MIIAKPIIAIILLVPYICTFGAVTFRVEFPDKTEICYDGWAA